MTDTYSRGETLGGYARYVAIGFTFVFIIGLFTAGGYFLDSLAGTLPLFLLVGMVAGLAAGMAYIYVQTRNPGG